MKNISKNILTSLAILGTVLLVTVSTSWLADLGKEHFLYKIDLKTMGLIFLTLILLGTTFLGISLAKWVAKRLASPDVRSFTELTHDDYVNNLKHTGVVITSLSTIAGKTPEQINQYIDHLFENFTIQQICETAITDINSHPNSNNIEILTYFPWQQQLRLLFEVTSYSKKIRLIVLTSHESNEQVTSFKYLIDRFEKSVIHEGLNLTIEDTIKKLDFTKINEVSEAIKLQLDECKPDPDHKVLIDVTAGQKTYSLAAVLSSVDKPNVLTSYVDTNAPFELRVQNIINDRQTLLSLM